MAISPLVPCGSTVFRFFCGIFFFSVVFFFNYKEEEKNVNNDSKE